MRELLENQRRLNEEIQRTTTKQDTAAAGITAIETRVNDLPGQLAATAAETITATQSASETLADRLTRTTVENAATIKSTLDALPTAITAAAPWWKLPLQALGLTGPLGAAAVAVTWLIAKRIQEKAASRPPTILPDATEVAARPFDAGTTTMTSDNMTPRPGDTVTTTGHGPIKTVTIDSPAPPQVSVPEVHFQSYETDRYAKAHAEAQRQIGRKFPNAVPYLESEREMIKQYLAS